MIAFSLVHTYLLKLVWINYCAVCALQKKNSLYLDLYVKQTNIKYISKQKYNRDKGKRYLVNAK